MAQRTRANKKEKIHQETRQRRCPTNRPLSIGLTRVVNKIEGCLRVRTAEVEGEGSSWWCETARCPWWSSVARRSQILSELKSWLIASLASFFHIPSLTGWPRIVSPSNLSPGGIKSHRNARRIKKPKTQCAPLNPKNGPPPPAEIVTFDDRAVEDSRLRLPERFNPVRGSIDPTAGVVFARPARSRAAAMSTLHRSLTQFPGWKSDLSAAPVDPGYGRGLIQSRMKSEGNNGYLRAAVINEQSEISAGSDQDPPATNPLQVRENSLEYVEVRFSFEIFMFTSIHFLSLECVMCLGEVICEAIAGNDDCGEDDAVDVDVNWIGWVDYIRWGLICSQMKLEVILRSKMKRKCGVRVFHPRLRFRVNRVSKVCRGRGHGFWNAIYSKTKRRMENFVLDFLRSFWRWIEWSICILAVLQIEPCFFIFSNKCDNGNGTLMDKLNGVVGIHYILFHRHTCKLVELFLITFSCKEIDHTRFLNSTRISE